jgi:hypothetical protein
VGLAARPHGVAHDVMREAATADLRAGVRSRRFHVTDIDTAWYASAGAAIGVIHAVLRGELGSEADSAHAEGVLRSFGVPPAEAAEIARRPLPPLRDPAA